MNNEFNSFENHFLQVLNTEMDFLSDVNMANVQFLADEPHDQTNESNETNESMEYDEIPEDELFENTNSISSLFQVMRETLDSVSYYRLIYLFIYLFSNFNTKSFCQFINNSTIDSKYLHGDILK